MGCLRVERRKTVVPVVQCVVRVYGSRWVVHQSCAGPEFPWCMTCTAVVVRAVLFYFSCVCIIVRPGTPFRYGTSSTEINLAIDAHAAYKID